MVELFKKSLIVAGAMPVALGDHRLNRLNDPELVASQGNALRLSLTLRRYLNNC